MIWLKRKLSHLYSFFIHNLKEKHIYPELAVENRTPVSLGMNTFDYVVVRSVHYYASVEPIPMTGSPHQLVIKVWTSLFMTH